ncbi:MFS general substrate transporter [Mollisia scopiformis]|uniref:MFS general substrate transporter n=1 Tax=Mollisia scopiformis TaxID=149040 RepID=A0A194XWQ7_MOLSC|nr:MFS general substrate transporter [Mollisia scopiformis]KUJ24464.1 MFS general substrate transporter [Mollisia scopiformis]
MIESFGVERKNVAKWAGIAGASFSFAQCLTAILWGRASDRFGRKPTILFALFCTMTASLVWGMSRSLPMAIAARALAGACNGNVGIIRTMVAEMVPQKELQPRAFSIMPLVWTIGSIFGPSFGGMFAKPTENLPWLFGGNKFFEKFPFLLPNLVAAALFIVGLTTGVFFLEETLETKKNQTDYGVILGKKFIKWFKAIFRLRRINPQPYRRASESFDESAASLLRPTSSAGSDVGKFDDESFTPKNTKSAPPRPTMKEVFTRQSIINLAAYTFLALHSVSFDQLLPIFLHLPPQVPNSDNTKLPFKFSGGFGLRSSRIGTLFTMYGVVGCFIQFLIFPPTARKFGVLNCFKVCAVTFPLVSFVTPYTALIQNSATQQAAIFGIMIVKCFAVIFAFPCSIILLTNSAVSLRILGTLNGFAVSISAIGRAIGPAMTGTVFTWGFERGYMITAWWLLGIIAAIGAIPIWYLVEMPGFSKSDSDSDDDDESLLPTVEEDEEGEARATEILEGDEIDDMNEEALDTVEGPPLSLVKSRKSIDEEGIEGRRSRRGSGLSRLERRMSSPIGVRGGSVGPGGGRRLSNGLAASNMGQGTGGSTFH